MRLVGSNPLVDPTEIWQFTDTADGVSTLLEAQQLMKSMQPEVYALFPRVEWDPVDGVDRVDRFSVESSRSMESTKVESIFDRDHSFSSTRSTSRSIHIPCPPLDNI